MIDPDYFECKRQELGMDRADTLVKVQTWLDERYPDQARAKSLLNGTLKITTKSSAVASELRFKQVEIIRLDPAITALQITV